jgi:RNA polymerase sigma factor (sigma-70 family)
MKINTPEEVMDDEACRRVMGECLRRHGYAIPSEEHESIKWTAVLRCLKVFRPDRKQKLSTSLFRYLKWECDNFRRQYRKPRREIPLSSISELKAPVPDRQEEIDHVRECMGMLDEPQREIVSSYYFGGMSLEEIGEERGYSRESARLNLARAMDRLRWFCLRGV